MSKKVFNPEARYQTINATAEITGMSAKWIRAKVKNNEIKHIMIGSEYRIDMPSFLKYLDEMSLQK